MGGFSARARYLTGQSKADKRRGAYTVGFVPSAGVHTRPDLKAIWLANGDDNLLFIKTSAIYSNDKLTRFVADRLTEATGEDMVGRVIMTANHSHNAYGPFVDQFHFFLGGDKYNEEIFQRYLEQAVEVSLQAHENLVPAKIGTAWAKDWDPNNRVYRDRRGDNNELHVWDDVEPGYGKDPWLHMLRADTLDDEPIAMMFNFGIHGIAMGEKSALISSDAPGSLEYVLQEEWPDSEDFVVMHVQGAGGDASPAGSDQDLARVESVGVYAVDPVYDLWDRTPLSTDPIEIEVASRHIWKHHSQIKVTRDGTVDWKYRPYEEGYIPDNEVYDANGDLISPIDEFNALYGGAFCGGEALIPGGGVGGAVYPYDGCTEVDFIGGIIAGIFDIPLEEMPLPMPETLKAGTTTALISGLQTLDYDGTLETKPLFMGFFPAEPTGMYAEQFRRRAKAELGYDRALVVGYAQDHEGYFLIPEDWLMGGYEPNINLWGPLEGEHVMEGMLAYSEEFLGTGFKEDPDPFGYYAMTEYADHPLPTILPDITPQAGTVITAPPNDYLWLLLERGTDETLGVDLTTPATMRRVQDELWMAWEGGDSMVDDPIISLQRLEGDDWHTVRTNSGRPLTDRFQDILVGHTPDPQYPIEAEQRHYYSTVWQAVGHIKDRMGLPLGTYRLHVTGMHWAGGDATWPWTTQPYEIEGDAFELLPATVSVEAGEGGLWAWVQAPADGWRLVDIEGSSVGANPLRGTVTIALDSGAVDVDVESVADGRAWIPVDTGGSASITVTDSYGNTGTLTPE
jgi:neutral ceramidase